MQLLAHLQNVVVWDVIFLAEEVARKHEVRKHEVKT
jgi:hypothetical protein